MCGLSDDPAKSSVVVDRELDQWKNRDPSGPRIRCPLRGWSPRKDDCRSCTCDHLWNTGDPGGVPPASTSGPQPNVCLVPAGRRTPIGMRTDTLGASV